ncbi:ATP-binding cassette, subfamily B [Actinopolymorpha cephalotaxi]|uniref:ATP-binding cassette subfamily B protein n=1 Tax=Actinopolymorpha cephalotaxi TaxID=504797 RepID=A0A1I3A967_9ACTN|nr:ATP-binding cassette domain-containing protein [Actinopolymorpha cephalotaxi]NYH85268.1 ATP-binding cassette subfamily B protein [Actinopolymorpha cephalotaxi]SFH46657.1 ATP-binding cassette, subfamily B [Actinopolymorpha cephalotaxi]
MPVPFSAWRSVRCAARNRYLLHLRLWWHAAPGLAIVCVALAVVRAGAITVAMVASGHLVASIDEAVRAGVDSAAALGSWRWLMLTVAAFVAAPVAGAVSRGVEEVASARYLAAYYDLVVDTGVRPHSVTHLEDPAGAQQLGSAVEASRDWLFLRGIGGTWDALSNKLNGVGALVVVATWRWWAGPVLLVGWLLLSRAVAHWRSVVFDDMITETGLGRRRASYLQGLLVGRAAAKEVRLYGLGGWLLDGFVNAWQETMAVVSRRRLRGVGSTLPPLAVLLVLNAAAFAVLTADTAAGRVSTGMLVTVVQGILGLSAFGRQDDGETSLGRTVSCVAALASFRTALGLPFLPGPPQATLAPAAAGTPTASKVELRDVTFGYPGGDRPVVERLRLTIPAGQSVAVVGVNGVGKSTIVKLLCGLWPPQAGEVRIDGLDPAVDAAARHRVSVIFQEFLRFGLPARANVEAGAGWCRIGDLDRIATDAGTDHIVAGLEYGWETILSAEFTGGTDLSGGQWQRIALARALAAVRAGAGVLVLDEPTAALDVRAEVALFESLLRLREGLTTILISHRLSSVRHADRIVVLGAVGGGVAGGVGGGVAGARVIEDGTHTELLAAGGEYARMFRLQASRFAAAGGVA